MTGLNRLRAALSSALVALGQDQAAGGDAGARCDHDRAIAWDLVDRAAPDLADRWLFSSSKSI